ncbi:type II and III secretion system protein family protein [Parasalinivibrio latis]|uniref:type II and III secretion system protein family protein n=1 Tax=Parasalinivibrio latis TaxID=2952610 RepID=UPI003DA619CD
MNIGVDEARTLSFREPIDTVFITNPDIADYQVISESKIVVFGRKVGNSSLLVFSKEGKTLANRKLVINKSLTHIQQQVQLRYPELSISIFNLDEQVVISGIVPTVEAKENIYSLVGELLKKDKNDYKINWDLGDKQLEIEFMTRRRYDGLVDNLEIATSKQVNVKLSVAEVSTAYIEELGVKWGSILGDGQFAGNGQFFDFVRDISAKDIAAFISAVNDDNIGQILAEPNLSVISGETASFLVGGELPIVTFYDDAYQITYKEFGVRLEVAAKVLRDDKIKLSLMPEVSSLDEQFKSDLLEIPAFKTRRARTTVELGNGESFVLGGLLSTEEKESLAKIPFIGDIPILGSLFRHTKTERRNTELIIVATVNLVEPISSREIKLPTMRRTSILNRWFAIPQKAPQDVKRWAAEIMAEGGFRE